MKTREKVLAGLVVLFVVSTTIWQLWWATQVGRVVLELATTAMYIQDDTQLLEADRDDLISIILEEADGKTREEIVSVAMVALGEEDVWEKDGYVNVGRLALRFDEEGRLVGID